MKTVRVIKSKKALPGFMKSDQVLIEYVDIPGRFYNKEMTAEEIQGVGVEIGRFEEHGGFDEWFDELEPVPFKDTILYKKIKPSLEEEKEGLEENIKAYQERIEFINDIISE